MSNKTYSRYVSLFCQINSTFFEFFLKNIELVLQKGERFHKLNQFKSLISVDFPSCGYPFRSQRSLKKGSVVYQKTVRGGLGLVDSGS
jgi:hypothetical protein